MSSIIFIGSPEKTPNKPTLTSFKDSFFVTPYDILFRIFASFMPPLGKHYRLINVDFLGPSLALLILAAIINYGYSFKHVMSLGPNEFLSLYCLLVPGLFYVLSKYVGKSEINLSEIISLLGYALFGHIFTLSTSYICFQEESNVFFFLSLICFSGMSTLRLIIVVLKTIPRPGARLLVCSILAIVQILSLIFVHFAYMHRTYKYRHVQQINSEHLFDNWYNVSLISKM